MFSTLYFKFIEFMGHYGYYGLSAFRRLSLSYLTMIVFPLGWSIHHMLANGSLSKLPLFSFQCSLLAFRDLARVLQP